MDDEDIGKGKVAHLVASRADLPGLWRWTSEQKETRAKFGRRGAGGGGNGDVLCSLFLVLGCLFLVPGAELFMLPGGAVTRAEGGVSVRDAKF